MKPEMILRADFEDLLFEYRNKDYGAYALRKDYNKRMYMSVAVMLFIALVFFLFQHWNWFGKEDSPMTKTFMTVCPVEIKQVELIKPKVVEPPKTKAATVQFTAPVLVKEIVSQLPAINELEKDVRIDVTTQEGLPESQSQVTPVTETLAGGADAVEEAPVIFEKVELMPEFPGGKAAMYRYISKKTRMVDNDLEPGTTKRVLCRFVVDAEGKVTQWTILQGAGSAALDAEVLRVIAGMPNWTPGMQNGKPVAVYFNLPFVFQAAEE